jgi:transposase
VLVSTWCKHTQTLLSSRFANLSSYPLRKGRIQPNTPIERGTAEWTEIYKRRTAVEREFGRLKHTCGLAFLRVRGIERVRLHADLTILGRLALELAKARAVSAAAA